MAHFNRRRKAGSLRAYFPKLPQRSPRTTRTARAAADATAANSKEILDDAGIVEVRRQLSAILDADGGVHGSHVRVIGLQALKEKVGGQWPKFHRIIHMMVEDVLARS